jgi:hypothetical protein
MLGVPVATDVRCRGRVVQDLATIAMSLSLVARMAHAYVASILRTGAAAPPRAAAQIGRRRCARPSA